MVEKFLTPTHIIYLVGQAFINEAKITVECIKIHPKKYKMEKINAHSISIGIS